MFVIRSPKDIANLKNEIEKRQKESDGAAENQEAVAAEKTRSILPNEEQEKEMTPEKSVTVASDAITATVS